MLRHLPDPESASLGSTNADPLNMDYLLPAAAYQPSSRPVRGTVLNTIIEDQYEGSSGHSSNESGTDTDEGTVIYNPIGSNGKGTATDATGRTTAFPPLPPAETSSPASLDHGRSNRGKSFDELYDASDNETEFSDSSSARDSASSRPTSFATDSTRNSVASSRSSTKHKYPAIMIPPSNMWPSLTGPVKGSPAVPPTPPRKILVSPAALSLLPRFVPAINAPPSLDGSSITSEQVSCSSAPVTPDMQNLKEGECWDAQHAIRLGHDEDSARVEVGSEPISPSDELVIEQPIDWDEIGSFPRIPGATPQEMSPIIPNLQGLGVLRPVSPSDRGVLLPSDALQTLIHLAPDRAFDARSESSVAGNAEMCENFDRLSRPRSADAATPVSNTSDYSISRLSIPSPERFFSSLKPGTRHTWFPTAGKQSNPPSSTTAENFYNVPWHQPQNIVEQMIEVEEVNTDGPPTARQHFIRNPPTTAGTVNTENSSTSETCVQDSYRLPNSPETGKLTLRSPQLRHEYEEAYESELMQCAAAHLDRTSTWLAAQISYLSALRETNPANSVSDLQFTEAAIKQEKNDFTDSSMKKMERFLEETGRAGVESTTHIAHNEEHAYYHAFQHLAHHTRCYDGFLHRTPRFDAVQTSRIALTSEHIDQLRGRYEVHEPTRPKYSGPFAQNPRATGVMDYTPVQMAFMTVEREKGVLDQVSPTYWISDALKYLNGGNLILSNAAKCLAKAALPLDDPNCVGSRRIRALDLGGNPSCDWAWHCAQQFPNVKTYTAINQSGAINLNITGPANHRLVFVSRLWKLPFRDNHFDLISARSLYAMLKHEPVPGHGGIDEYDLCLRECYRVLKPGGYLEFMLMDADMAHAGPLANAMSVEFGFKLKTRGYDPSPTKSFLGRLRKTNFTNIKRAWIFLPAGAPTQDLHVPRGTPEPDPPLAGAATARGPLGSTADVANVTGLLGSWMWEQWMLTLQTEMGVEKEKLLKGVAGVIEESRNCAAGWRCLSGWARKPKPKSEQNGKIGRRARAPTTETIHIKMEEK